ncbi:MAG: small multi-drug export protein [Candidatus Thermoplasmatota archaeon]|nr:small multi-drug export protein [Candidatus Thermoplasmatota archaeon]
MEGQTGRGKKLRRRKGKGVLSLLKRLLETDLEKKDRVTKIFQFLFPWTVLISIAIISVLLLDIWKGWGVASHLVDIWVFYTLPPAGKETIIPKAVAGGVPAWIAGPSTMIVDSCVSLFLIWNYDWVKKVPVLGPALEKAEVKGRKKVEKARWFRRAAFLFTTFAVFVPLSGSGGFGGTIFGRILGMRPYTVLLAVFLGSLLGSTIFAILSEKLVDFLEGTPVIEFLNNLNMIQIVIVIIAVGFLIYAIRNPKKAAETTTRAVSKAIDTTEKAVIVAEEKRKQVTRSTIDGTKNTMRAMGSVNRTVVDLNLDIATRPIDMMGPHGRRIASSARKVGKRTVDNMHRTAGKVIDRALVVGEKATNWTVEGVEDITLEGIGQTRKAWMGAGKVMIRGGERLEDIVRRKKKGSLKTEDASTVGDGPSGEE